MTPIRLLFAAALLVAAAPLGAQNALQQEIDRRAVEVNGKVVAWRRDIHQHPELSGEEARTAALVATHLRALGLEVRTGVGGHGVVGILRGGRPGRVVALRADMDGLPVTELVDLPFRSRERATFRGQEVGVMHACGHDNHVAILMGAAEVLTAMRARLSGTVVFIFQPAEEGHPDGGGGAERMLRDGVFDDPKVEAIFGLHVGPGPVGALTYRPGPTMAASNSFTVTVHGRQSHGARPWDGVDPIVASAQVILGLQTIISRQTDITEVPAIVTVGAINGGIRSNIIPDSVVMIGTIRTFELEQRAEIFRRIIRTVEQIAASSGASAVVRIDSGYSVTRNDEALTAQMLPTLRRVAGAENVSVVPLRTGAEDFSYFQERVPGLFVFLGVTPRDQDWRTVPANHSPLFFADEGALPVGVRTMASLALDWLSAPRGR
ncbi:MAG: amidohydrolase [Gemmatimonadaceae bacterium]